MSIGLILLIVVGLLILFGVAQRVLDKLRLTDKQALLFVALIIVGGLLPDIPFGDRFSLNIGGALIPLALCVYLLVKAGTAKEVFRALAASALTAVAVYWIGRLLPAEPENLGFDPIYLYGIAAGIIGYLFGRSRRGSFIAGVLGMLAADTFQAILLWTRGSAQRLVLGGAGAMDAVVIAGLMAVLLAELIGEAIERMTRGRNRDETREFKDGEFVRRERRK